MSLFNDPYIHSCKINNDTIVLNVYFMEKECGYINITREKTNSIISCGSKSFKGSMKRENVEFEYIKGNFVITDTRTKKRILKIKCPMVHSTFLLVDGCRPINRRTSCK
jgi:hypothetical protein